MGLFDMFSSFLNPGKGYKKGQEQLDKYYQQGQNYLQPYQQHGEEAYGHLNEAMQDLLNPSGLHDRWLQDYQQSDAATMAQERAMNQGNRAASSMGLSGSSPALQAIQAGTNQIGAEDQQRYIEQMIQQYLQGAGLAQDIYGVGANAGNQLSNNATNMGQNSAQMKFNQVNAPGELFGKLLGAGANLYGAQQGANAMNNMSKAWSTTGGQ